MPHWYNRHISVLSLYAVDHGIAAALLNGMLPTVGCVEVTAFEELSEDLLVHWDKTESSLRSVYIPNTVASALLDLKKSQEKQRRLLHGTYQEFGMVIAQPDGRPTEERLLAKSFKGLLKETGLPKVVFHSLRHLSASMKLQISGGDIKAVQGDTGHSQSNMVTDVYSHTFDENRKRIADQMESTFFERIGETGREPSAEQNRILTLLNDRPELAALILAMAR